MLASLAGFLLTLVEPITDLLLLVPEVPPVQLLTVPFPNWLPSEPLVASIVQVGAAAGTVLLLRLVRWVYGMAPVVQ